MSEQLPIYVRVAHAQRMFGLHRSTIYRKAEAGEITIHKRAGASFLKTSEMMEYIEGPKASAENA